MLPGGDPTLIGLVFGRRGRATLPTGAERFGRFRSETQPYRLHTVQKMPVRSIQ